MTWRTDPNGRWKDVPERWVAFVGRSVESQLGDGWTMMIHPEDRMQVVARIAAAMAARERFIVPFRVQRHDGQWIPVRSAGMPQMRDGVFVGYAGGIYLPGVAPRQASAGVAPFVVRARERATEAMLPVNDADYARPPRRLTDSL